MRRENLQMAMGLIAALRRERDAALAIADSEERGEGLTKLLNECLITDYQLDNKLLLPEEGEDGGVISLELIREKEQIARTTGFGEGQEFVKNKLMQFLNSDKTERVKMFLNTAFESPWGADSKPSDDDDISF